MSAVPTEPASLTARRETAPLPAPLPALHPAAGLEPDPTLVRALEHLARVQWPSGAWEAEVVWNSMLTAQYVIVRHLTRHVAGELDEKTRRLLVQQFRATRTPEGGWGMHPESGPYVYFTTMAYVALRLLGVSADDPHCAQARRWLHARPRDEGVLAIPSWGKLWLSLIGLYGYEGVNPFPPELYVLPEWVPFHPNRFYCHTRYIYLGIAYLYGRRARFDLGPITEELRAELYTEPYGQIDFARARHLIAPTDLYVRPSPTLRALYDLLYQYERVADITPLRQVALDRCLERILYEQRVSRYQGISPVNGLLNCLALLCERRDHPELGPSLEGVESWRWQDEAEGIRYAGAHSTAWDTAFVLRAALEAPDDVVAQFATPIRRGYGFLRDTQLLEELPDREKEARDPIVGGWCFSDGVHRWPVSDCTAEALSAIVALHQLVDQGRAPGLLPADQRISDERLRLAVGFILQRQNDDGGFGTYERRRAGGLLEQLNPSEMYGNCMTERSYLECTSSCIGALARVRAAYPGLLATGDLRSRVDRAIERGARFLLASQRPDGSWPGFWGVNFTYAIFHACEGLLAAGLSPSHPALERAARWLLSHQKSDGSWGEHYMSCLDDRYVEHPEGQVTMTAWAVLSLLHLADPGSAASLAAERGIAFLKARQGEDGAWPRQAVAGVFFGTAMLDYRLYKDYFALWALARYQSWPGRT